MIVLDASVVVDLLLDMPRGAEVKARIAADDSELAAPHLLDAEVAHVLRRLVLRETLRLARAEAALEDLAALPIQRHGHLPLLRRAFALREHVTVYDALYVALTETLDGVLLTADRALARIPRSPARVEWIAS